VRKAVLKNNGTEKSCHHYDERRARQQLRTPAISRHLPFLGVSKQLGNATGMSIAVIFVMLLATAATWPIQTFLLDPNGLGYLQTIVFILVIAALVQLVEITLKKYIPPLYSALGVYPP
jgi:Na+-translocating ferredoxin:NAD+ oxidoreductase RnfA subunit